MNIVQIQSGLGNQMFQYAFYLALKHRRPETKIDSSIFRYRPSHNGYELERVFDIHPEHATAAERDRMADVSKDWFSVLRRAIGWHRHTSGQLVREPDPAKGWCAQLLQAENSYLQGYWQSEKYFAEVKEQVRDAFRFRMPLPPEDESLAQAMKVANSVSIHVRRGDYLKERRKEDYDVCSDVYYRRAIAYMQEKVPNAVFYVFSDEPEGLHKELFPKGTIFVSGHSGEKAYIDLQLMSRCRHHIIANSSFSWWGAWLGQQEETITVAPKIWFRHRQRPDIVPTNWIAINVE